MLESAPALLWPWPAWDTTEYKQVANKQTWLATMAVIFITSSINLITLGVTLVILLTIVRRTVPYIITVNVPAEAASTFVILNLGGFSDFVRSHFLTGTPHNESHNHYRPKVSCSNPLLYQMTFPCSSSPTISISPLPGSNYTLFIWPPGCPLKVEDWCY